MAELGNQGDATPKSNDDVQDVNNNSAEADASNRLLADSGFSRPDVAASTDKGAEKWDPKQFEATAKSLTEAIAAIEAKYFKPDTSGTSIMDRMKQGAPDLYATASAQFSQELVAPSEQSIAGIRGLMKKLQA